MKTPTEASRMSQALILGLIALGVIARLVPHPWNASPVAAIALFGGALLSRRWSLLLPLGIVALSDLFLGLHATIPFTWSAFALTGAIGWGIRRQPTPTRILAGSLIGSGFFFVLTNFGVWLIGGLYPRTLEGLWTCYVAAIPFVRATVVGDLVYTTTFFGLYALATRAFQRVTPVAVRS